MSTFDPNNLDIDFDNLDKQVEHDTVRDVQPKQAVKSADPLEEVPASTPRKQKPSKQYTVEKTIPSKKKEAKKHDSMLSEILDGSDNTKADKENTTDTVDDKKVVYDINVENIDDIMQLLITNEYDFVTLEPEEDHVKVIFRQDKTPVNTKLIKYVTYTKLLLKIKALTKLTVEDTESSQVGAGEYKYKNNWYKLASKTSPSPHGEKVFLKASEIAKKLAAQRNQKASFKTMLKFIGIVAFLFLILGGTFITFVVLNANSVEDVSFFQSLGIEPSDINVFISKVVTVIFAILVFLESIFVFIYGFKFFLTKKSQKRKRLVSGILATLFLIVTFATASVWLFIDKKVNALPNWGSVSRGAIQIYDTDILASESFDEEVALLRGDKLTQLIGPIDLRFDVGVLSDAQERQGFRIEKYIWDFGSTESSKRAIVETATPVVFYTFDEKRTYDITLTLEGLDAVGKPLIKTQKIPKVEITDVIDIEETTLDSGGKRLKFNAESLKQKGTLEWYYGDNYEVPVSKGYIFQPGKAIFEETVIALYIKNSLDKTDQNFDRVFIIKPESDDNITGDILAEPNPDNNLEYEFSVADIQNDFGGGTIETFKWVLDSKEFLLKGNIEDLEKSSRVPYIFKSYGEHEVSVVLTDSLGKSKTLNETINISKQLLLSTPLEILDSGSALEALEYKQKLGQYWIDDLPIPTTLTFSAQKLKPEDNRYSLSEVKWDFDLDGDIDATGKYVDYEIPIAGDKKVKVFYTFTHRTRDTTLEISEEIYIQAIKKDAILRLNIENSTQYVPTTVRFDASQSSVLGEDIVKFEYDYGDGIIEERDAINEGHVYREPGEYDIKLTVTTQTGQKHSITKKLVLKTKPDIVKITPSLYDAPIFQEIDFSSDDSSGQIISYYWEFGDGNSSTSANPSHSYEQPGEYTVKLLIEFANNNTKVDEIKVNILP